MEKMWHARTRVLLSHKEEQNYAIYKKTDETAEHHVEGKKPDSESPGP